MEKAFVKVWRIVSIIAVIVLTLAFFPRIACSETPKGAIEDRASMACIPPEDKSSCENIPSGISEAAQPIIQVYNECAKMTQDPALQSKFFWIVSLLAMGPPGYAMVSKYMTGEVKDEFLKCVFKGLIEAGDWTDEEKALRKDMLDKVFATKDFVTIPSDTFQGVKKLLDGDTVEALADFFGAGSDTVERYTEHEKFDDILTRSSELFFGIPERVRNILRDIEANISECQFDPARVKAAEAAGLMDTYCNSKGAVYRKLEKRIRCYRERNSRILELQSRGGGPQHDRLSGMQTKLNVFRDGLVRDLLLIDDVKRIRDRIEERKRFFDESRASYLKICSETAGFLVKEDLKQACTSLEKLMTIEGMQSRECLAIMSAENRQCRGGKSLEIELNQSARNMEGAVELLFEQAESRIKSCQIEEARNKLDTALQKSPLIWSLTGSGCQPWQQATTIAARRERLLKRIEGIEADRKKANDLIASAKTMAGDLCRYEDALSGELSETRIWTVGINGCIPDLSIQAGVEEIKRIQKASADKAESLEKSVLDQVEKAKTPYATDETPLRCTQDESGLDGALASAAPLLCEGVSPLPEGVRQRAERVTSGINSARQFIKESVERRAAKALQIVDQALSSAAESLARCDPGKAKGFLEQLDREVHPSCLTEIQSGKKSSLEEESQELEKEMLKRTKGIEVLCGEAKKTLKSCEWKALNDQITKARESLPRKECRVTYPVFNDLEKKLNNLESLGKTREAQVAAFSKREYDLRMIKTAGAFLDAWEGDKQWGASRRDNFNRNIGPLKKLRGEIIAADLRECMSGMVSQIEEILARAEKLPGTTDEADKGFGAAGEGQTQQGDPAAPDKQTDGGFSAAGPGVTKKNDPGNPAEGFFAAGIPGITTPLASPDSGGFSSAGSGATSHSDPTAGNDGRSGSRDARPPTAVAGTPRSDSTPIIVGPQPFRGDGQPAAVHIFGATSRMGWAGGLAQYSVGPADQSIVEHLMTAGEHVMWANKMSFPPTPAWPGWSEKRSWLQSQANELSRNRTNQYRRQIAGSMSGNYGSMCSELSVQTFGTTQKAANCDAYYCRLGFLMARGQQALLIADEANNNRDKQTADKARADGLSHLSQAVQVLSDYEKVLAVSGRCADLRDVKQMLMNIIRGGNIPDQARAATAAWQTALERIAALGQGGAPQPGKYEECLKKYCPECLQTIDLLGVAKDPKCSDCKRKNEKLINECVAGTPSPVGPPVQPQPTVPRTLKDPRPNVSTELEGVWTEWIVLRYEGRGYRFSLQSGGDVSDERKFFFETKDRDDLRELLRKITASAKDMTNININPRRRITVEFRKSGGQYSGCVTQGSMSLDDSLFGRHIGSKLSPGTEVFKFNRVGEDEYAGDYLDRSFGNRWVGGGRFIVLGDFAVEKLRDVIIWKKVR